MFLNNLKKSSNTIYLILEIFTILFFSLQTLLNIKQRSHTNINVATLPQQISNASYKQIQQHSPKLIIQPILSLTHF